MQIDMTSLLTCV